MQQVTNLKEIESVIDKNGEVVVSKNDENSVIVMSIEEYKNKLLDKEIEKKLLMAEEHIENRKTIKATEVFKELEEKYGFWKRAIWNKIYRR